MNKKTLMEILLDPNTSDAVKDDAVIDLGINFQDDETIDFLINVSNDNRYDEMIVASCGESLAHIWISNKQIDHRKLLDLKGVALAEAISMIQAQCPD
ncbi:hypothetical protein [Paenibacillus polysaccharolyticus]|uniref:hypothetical protein n=1 Tax=Paenibacillus polysaccharolyticus TaxID=582692 RepID=UPI00280AFEFC|nr:hypothetical protein [Paenibacillus polysaccharolyticus]